jgi:hypothetical protein
MSDPCATIAETREKGTKMKVAVNRCFGGFGLSKAAYAHMGLEWDGYGYAFSGSEQRNDPKLIEAIETLGTEVASGPLARVEVVEIPNGIDWTIEEYDGQEWVSEVHRTW